MLTLLPRLLRLSQKGALFLHTLPPPPPPLAVRRPRAFMRDTSPVSKTLLVFYINQRISASFSLSLSYRRLQTARSQSIKRPKHYLVVYFLFPFILVTCLFLNGVQLTHHFPVFVMLIFLICCSNICEEKWIASVFNISINHHM